MKSAKGGELLLVVAGYSALTVLLTLPAVFRLSTHFMHASPDGLQSVWNLWWIKKALSEGLNPFYTQYLYHPHGITLLFHTLHPLEGLLSLPFQYLFGMELAYNAVVLFSFVMSGLGMYLLSRTLTGHRPAAFVAGMVYTFSPYHFAHAVGHLHLVAMEWVPFYVLCLVQMYRAPGSRNCWLAILFLILNAFCSWYYLMFCLLMTATIAVYLLLFDRPYVVASGFLRRLTATLLGFFLCMFPLFGSMIAERSAQAFEVGHPPDTYLADLASFFVPTQFSTWGRLWFRSVSARWSGSAAENSNYLGYLVLLLSFYAARRVPAARLWAFTAGVFALLALGPHLQINGWDTHLPLPYLWLHEYVPLFSFAGVPTRFDAMIKLSLAILVGYAIREICRRRYAPPEHSQALPQQRLAQSADPPWTASWREFRMVGLVGLLIGIEYLPLPFATMRVPVPLFYRQLAEDPESYAILEIPTTGLDVDGYRMYYATVHQKPLVAGDIARRPLAAVHSLDANPIIATLMHRWPAPPPAAVRQAVAGLVADNIRYVIAHDDRYRELIEEGWHFPKVYDDGQMKAYRVE